MHVHNFSVVENAILSPRLVNQVTLGTNYFLQTFDDVNIGFDPLAMGLEHRRPLRRAQDDHQRLRLRGRHPAARPNRHHRPRHR